VRPQRALSPPAIGSRLPSPILATSPVLGRSLSSLPRLRPRGVMLLPSLRFPPMVSRATGPMSASGVPVLRDLSMGLITVVSWPHVKIHRWSTMLRRPPGWSTVISRYGGTPRGHRPTRTLWPVLRAPAPVPVQCGRPSTAEKGRVNLRKFFYVWKASWRGWSNTSRLRLLRRPSPLRHLPLRVSFIRSFSYPNC
jgi:hypothetical protein